MGLLMLRALTPVSAVVLWSDLGATLALNNGAGNPEPDSGFRRKPGLTFPAWQREQGLQRGTVRDYVRAVYKKLHVHCRTEAVVKYRSV